MDTTNEKLLSLLIPAFNSSKRLRPAYEALRNCLDAEQIPFEMLIIDGTSQSMMG